MRSESEKNDAKQDLLIIDAETGLLSHPSTFECVSPNSWILLPNLFGASSRESPCIIVLVEVLVFSCPRPQWSFPSNVQASILFCLYGSLLHPVDGHSIFLWLSNYCQTTWYDTWENSDVRLFGLSTGWQKTPAWASYQKKKMSVCSRGSCSLVGTTWLAMLRPRTIAQPPSSWVSRRRFWKRLRRRGILASKGVGGVEMPHCVVGQVFCIVSKDWIAAFFRIQQSKCLALALIDILFPSLPFPLKQSRATIPADALRPCPVHISNIHQRFSTPVFIRCQHLYNASCFVTWLVFLDSEQWKMMIMVLQNIRKYLPSDILKTWILESLWGGGMQWRSWLRHCATSRKVAGSIPDYVIGHNPSGRTVA